MPDVVVLGLGPSGRALANRCLRRGLSVTAIDPHPDRSWIATYGAWADELPEWLPSTVVAARTATPSVWGTHRHDVDRSYVTLGTSALRDALDVTGAEVRAGSAIAVTGSAGSMRVTTGDDRIINVDTVIDARGASVGPGIPEQTAYGIVVPTATAAPALGGVDAWFMDWRRDNGTSPSDSPSFLYAIPLGDDRMLLEETCLIGDPGLPLPELGRRLHARLRGRGVVLSGNEPIERVRFAVRPPVTPSVDGVIPVGARGGGVHPATGYSVAASLRAASGIADALAAGTRPPADARGRAVRRLRTVGSDALLSLAPDETAKFFDAFFALPVPQQRSYLSETSDLAGLSRAMLGTFRTVSPRTRFALARAVVGGIVTDR